MQYGKFFLTICCKRDFPCILHFACFLFISVKTYWNCPRKPVAETASLDNALKVTLTYESFKGIKDSFGNVFIVFRSSLLTCSVYISCIFFLSETTNLSISLFP